MVSKGTKKAKSKLMHVTTSERLRWDPEGTMFRKLSHAE
jgi:hypothetical protein